MESQTAGKSQKPGKKFLECEFLLTIERLRSTIRARKEMISSCGNGAQPPDFLSE